MVSDIPETSPDSRFAVWIGATIALLVAALAVGFVILPAAQNDADGSSLWGVICRAVGIPSSGNGLSSVPAGAQPASGVAWTVATRKLLSNGDAVQGAAAATACSNCHNANGVSADAAIPNLAGQSVASLYKQLLDFKSGKRNAAVMGVFVASLSTKELLDLATYYAAQPEPFAEASSRPNDTYVAARRLVEFGDPARSIAGCAACHGSQGQTQGAPGLRGQQRAYLEQQLQDFKFDNRHNDITEQMRTVARRLTQQEIAALVAYYASFSGASDGQ